MTLQQVAKACAGVLTPAAAARKSAGGAAIDSRRLRAGEVFFALQGKAQDGHAFVQAAAAARAACAVVQTPQTAALPQIVVQDTRAALQSWARAARAAFAGQVAAITGSNGKTTVKEMLRAVCVAHFGKRATLATSGNFNNALGAPLTLSRLRPPHKVLVAEAGMDTAGELALLSNLLRPHVALINNAQRAHIGNFASLADVARAKGELLQGLPPNGIAALNADDAHFALWKKLAGGRRVWSFGFARKAQTRGERVGEDFYINGDRVCLQLRGRHNQSNALAAAAAAAALGAPPDKIVRGLESCVGAPARLQFARLQNNCLLIDDSYNANPDSAAAALAVLRQTAREEGMQALFVLGEMAQLGASAPAAHKQFAADCAAAGAQLRLLPAKAAANKPQRAALRQELRALARAGGVCFLIKGSRRMGMEEFANALREEFAP